MSKILIVEDEEAIADLEKDYLELSGFDVEIENDGTSGMERALNEDFDMFILDLNDIIFLCRTADQAFIPCQMCFYPGNQFARRKWLCDKSSAPSPSPRILSISSFFAETISTGVFFFSRIFRQISNPSVPGSMRSRINISKSSFSARSIPLVPSFSISTSKPLSSR